MSRFYKNQFFWISLGFTALVAWGFVIAQRTQNTESNNDHAQTLQEKTLERARLVGRQLIESNFMRKVFVEKPAAPAARGLASVPDPETSAGFKMQLIEEGQTGRDPWGYPFSYMKKNDKLFIWSMGPNHVLDSTAEQIRGSETQGDDLIVTVAI